jgi:ribonuclease P/MRP protein subunit POP8
MASEPTEIQSSSMSHSQALNEEASPNQKENTTTKEDTPDSPSTTPQTSRPNASKIHHTATLRSPTWTYFHISLYTTTPSEIPLDALTVRRYITSALSRSFGLTGSAIPVDILKLEGDELWIRVPLDDAMAVHESLSSWVGAEGGGVRWVVKGRDEWLVRLVGGDGQDLFR